MTDDVTFVCEDCGSRITLPGERRGRVEICPSCGSYVDVPDRTEGPPPAESTSTAPASPCGSAESKPPQGADGGPRTDAQLWIEVLAVLCLAYLPAMFGTVAGVLEPYPSAHSFVYRQTWSIVDALQVSVPLLMILALTKDPWPLFGIVRFRWMVDILGGCAIWGSEIVIYLCIMSLLPSPMFDEWAWPHAARHLRPEGLSGCLLLLVACIAGSFSQELVMRGYLIPRLERLLRSTAAAILVTSVLYASYHLYQGMTPAVGHVVTGLVYAITFCIFRRLWPLCVAHALHNFLASL